MLLWLEGRWLVGLQHGVIVIRIWLLRRGRRFKGRWLLWGWDCGFTWRGILRYGLAAGSAELGFIWDLGAARGAELVHGKYLSVMQKYHYVRGSIARGCLPVMLIGDRNGVVRFCGV